MKDCLKKLVENKDLSFSEVQNVVREIAANEVSEAQIGAFLVAITQKGVSNEEFFALASAMREFSHRIISDKYIVDSCGTGADLSKTINISTASAIVASVCGVNIIKQTNSAITSRCGSTDFLKALNIPVLQSVEATLRVFDEKGIAFVHSPFFNDFAAINNPIRQQIGVKTVFNYLGPLINPSFPNAQLLGVSSLEMCEKVVYALKRLKTDRALVVNGLSPNLDEISLCSETKVYELRGGEISEYYLSPSDFGLKTVDIAEIVGGNALENAKIVEDIFKGEIKSSKRDVIALNAGAMIYLSGQVASIREGLDVAQGAIEGGAAFCQLKKLGASCDAEFVKTV